MADQDRITLTGIRGTGHHGVFESERLHGQNFIVDLTVYLDTRPAAAGDELTQTMHYGELAEKVHDVITGEPVDLLEKLAHKIAGAALSYAVVEAVEVTVNKPEAPITVPFSNVAVTIYRTAEERDQLNFAPASIPAPKPIEERASEPLTVPPLGDDSKHPLEERDVRFGDESADEPVPAPPVAEPLGSSPADEPLTVPPLGDDMDQTMVSLPDQTASMPAVSQQAASIPPPSAPPPPPSDPLDEKPSRPIQAVLSLGANLGSPQETLAASIQDIRNTPGVEVTGVSPLARTVPVGPEQPDFYNCVAEIRTDLSPRELLLAMQGIEDSHGREREERWGPRTLDIDVIAYDDLVADSVDLEIPHPRAHERAFVLTPWAQLNPNAQLPGLGGGPVTTLARTAPDRDGIRWMSLDWL